MSPASTMHKHADWFFLVFGNARLLEEQEEKFRVCQILCKVIEQSPPFPLVSTEKQSETF